VLILELGHVNRAQLLLLTFCPISHHPVAFSLTFTELLLIFFLFLLILVVDEGLSVVLQVNHSRPCRLLLPVFLNTACGAERIRVEVVTSAIPTPSITTITSTDDVIVILILCDTLSSSERLQTGTSERIIAVAAVAWVQLLGK
jgi:hypothetical protein